MTRRTHVEQLNGTSRGPLVDSIRPYADQIRFALGRMNGSSVWAYSLWRAAEDANLLEEIPFSDRYIQSAGSADAMTVEVRELDDHGDLRQYVVGRPTQVESPSPTAVISWDSGRYSTTVFPHEVFAADEAAKIFYEYFRTDEVPPTYTPRELS